MRFGFIRLTEPFCRLNRPWDIRIKKVEVRCDLPYTMNAKTTGSSSKGELEQSSWLVRDLCKVVVNAMGRLPYNGKVAQGEKGCTFQGIDFANALAVGGLIRDRSYHGWGIVQR